jgi:hypothetical protein
MMYSLNDFCQEYFKAMGCLIEPSPDATYEVILPDEVAPFFKQGSYLKVSFTPDIRLKNDQVELLTYGSPVLSGMIESSLHMGRTTRNFATGLSLKKGNISQRILEEYSLRPERIEFSPSFPAMTRSPIYQMRNMTISIQWQ